METLLQQLADGISAASLVTILAGLLVLAGAIAAGSRARAYDATILKVLGATRARIALVYRHRIWRAGRGHRRASRWWRARWRPGRRRISSWMCRSSFDARAVLVTVVGGGAATLLFGLLGALTRAVGPAGARGCGRLNRC